MKQTVAARFIEMMNRQKATNQIYKSKDQKEFERELELNPQIMVWVLLVTRELVNPESKFDIFDLLVTSLWQGYELGRTLAIEEVTGGNQI